MTRHALVALAALAASLTLLVAACGGDGPESAGPVPTVDVVTEPAGPGDTGGPPGESTDSGPAPTEPAPPETEPAETFAFEVWFARDAGAILGEDGTEISLGPLLFSTSRTAEETPRVARAALEALLAGPSPAEQAAGVSTAIPDGTRLLDVTIEDGIAIVDLSSEYESGGGSLAMMLRLAQVVYTVTQFPTVAGVQFELDGQPVEVFSGEGIVLDHPVTREDYEDVTSPITVVSPSIGERVESPARIVGTANVFEATVTVLVLDAQGGELARDFTTATCGTGCRGEYELELPFSVGAEQPGTIVVEDDDAAGVGRPPHVVEIPVTLVP